MLLLLVLVLVLAHSCTSLRCYLKTVPTGLRMRTMLLDMPDVIASTARNLDVNGLVTAPNAGTPR